MIEITKTDVLAMLGQQDPNVMTTQINKDGIRVPPLPEEHRVEIPALMTILQGKMTLMFMLHFAAALSDAPGYKPETCHFNADGFQLMYDAGTEESILDAIKVVLLAYK